LADIPGLPPTPTLPSRTGPQPQVGGLPFNDIQGDILWVSAVTKKKLPLISGLGLG
jgi:hypothetical protein